MKQKKQIAGRHLHQDHNQVKRFLQDSVTGSIGQSVEPAFRPDSRLVSLRHHPSLWLAPAALLILALLPWPYGFYNLLRLAVCAVSAWLAYEQWKHDNAVSAWVVALGATALLFNPLLPIHLNREIWFVLDIVVAGIFLGHLKTLKKLLNAHNLHSPPTERLSSLASSRSATQRTIRPVAPRPDDPESS